MSQPRVDAIRRGGDRWLRGLAGRPVVDTWAGLRPCLPDGLPAVGRLGRVVVATGHAMKGVALSPVTGRLVAQLVSGEEPEHDLAPLEACVLVTAVVAVLASLVADLAALWLDPRLRTGRA